MTAERVELEPLTMMGVHEVVPMDQLTEYFGRAITVTATDAMCEEYLVDPGSEPDPANWQTRLTWLFV
ncbi:hypothetical protein [Cryobacterium psychrophilum]|uniref:Uncharacterized protein n=1 Tax=Cryobacterium psychrophilum TaxID=41988 RepID=A0A4Y8KNY2_9MICO|nr:hypothetical protein [Cryobacterium psychrophilum]TFD80000.1 hypothetical protein E3T53_06255 [Cryobacterium psychrophilum]